MLCGDKDVRVACTSLDIGDMRKWQCQTCCRDLVGWTEVKDLETNTSYRGIEMNATQFMLVSYAIRSRGSGAE